MHRPFVQRLFSSFKVLTTTLLESQVTYSSSPSSSSPLNEVHACLSCMKLFYYYVLLRLPSGAAAAESPKEHAKRLLQQPSTEVMRGMLIRR